METREYNVGPLFMVAKLVNITPISMVYMVLITLVRFTNQLTRGRHIVASMFFCVFNIRSTHFLGILGQTDEVLLTIENMILWILW